MDRGLARIISAAVAGPLAFTGAVLAAGCARQGEAPPPSRERADIVLPVETLTFEAMVPRQATLETLLLHHELPVPLVQAAIESARTVFNPRQLRAERPYRLVRSIDGFLREFEYQIDADRFLRIVSRDRSDPESLNAEVLLYEKEMSVVTIRGRIDGEHASLVSAVDATGERVQLAISLAEIFSGQIDFENDLQPGDAFEVLFESTTYQGQFAGYGAILAARFTNEGKEHHAYRWVHPGTLKAGYYDEQGRSLRRFVLASPLRFTPRVTSGFSRRRLHPVHRTVRAHLGVDYAAPTGTPVVAVASGAVVSAGWAGGGGRQVRIRHARGFESYYLHLSAFAKGISAGAHVDQGQLIGRVGSTGTATGPHLDYRLRKNGVFVDPRREHARQPPGEPIPTMYLTDFSATRDHLLQQFTTTVAAEPLPAADGEKQQP
jgi:murein DD-endopeptidase MepM/ murein hydrolase activator NlpD